MKKDKVIQKKCLNFNIKHIELASQDEINKCPEELELLLCELEHSEALVTDESALTDFWTFMKRAELIKKAKALQKKLGVKVNYKDYLIEVVKRMKEKNEKAK